MSFAINSNHHKQLIKLLQQHQRGKLIPQWSQDTRNHAQEDLPGNELACVFEQRRTLGELMRDSDHNLLIL